MEVKGGEGVYFWRMKDEGCFTSLYLLQNLKDEETTYLIQI